MNFTDEALEFWNQLSETEQAEWTENLFCQKCKAEIDPANMNGSVHEGQLAFFHECSQCSNKEVRLVDVMEQSQKAIDDDFEKWAKSKRAARPELFDKKGSS
jgi:hypothetical protein